MKVLEATRKSVSSGAEIADGFDEVGAVDVRDEAEGEIALRVVLERFVGHDRAEVRAADADVDDVADALAGVALPCAAADFVGEGGHLVQHGVHAGNDVFAIDEDRFALRRAKCNVKHRAVFRDVDLVAAKHRIDAVSQAALVRELHEQLERVVGDAVLRVVEEDADGVGGVARAALRVLVEELTQRGLCNLLRMRLERLPRGLLYKGEIGKSG